MCYNGRMTNDYDPQDDEIMYDDSLDEMSDAEAVDLLVKEGYSEDEAKRMVGLYDADDDETSYGYDDLDRDVPDFVDEEDFG